MKAHYYNEENIIDIASKINSYEDLIKINVTKYEGILQMKTKNLIIKIAKYVLLKRIKYLIQSNLKKYLIYLRMNFLD